MHKSKKRFLGFVAALMLANGFLSGVQLVQAKEPSYHGKPLSEVICCADPDEQYKAYAQMGTNCLPLVLDLIGATDKKMKWTAMGAESGQLRDMAASEDAGISADIRERASRAFEVLGTNAVSAIPRLVKIMNQNDEMTSIYAADALAKVGPKGFAALTNLLASKKANTRAAAISEVVHGDFAIVKPMLIEFLKDKNPDIRRWAAEGLARRDSEVAIPMLIPVLDDTNVDVKAAAAASLGSYGAKAKSALPKIVAGYTNSITDTNFSPYVYQSFSDALKAIDLDAARQAVALVIDSPKNGFREYYTRTKLINGLELIAGGKVDFGQGLFQTNYYLASAQLFDPKTGKWAETGEMTLPRFNHAAVLLTNGNVLVAGGCDKFGKNRALSSSELYDPQTGKWSETGAMTAGRYDYAAVLLPNGKVFVVGGENETNPGLSSAELYDPSTGKWSLTTSMHRGHYGCKAKLNPNGTVLVFRELYNNVPPPDKIIEKCEQYDPATATWTIVTNQSDKSK